MIQEHDHHQHHHHHDIYIIIVTSIIVTCRIIACPAGRQQPMGDLGPDPDEHAPPAHHHTTHQRHPHPHHHLTIIIITITIKQPTDAITKILINLSSVSQSQETAVYWLSKIQKNPGI